MKPVPTIQLQAGTTATTDYYDSHGTLLIARGRPVTDQFLDALRNGRQFELYTKPSTDDDIIALLEKEFETLDDLEIDTGSDDQPFTFPCEPLLPPSLKHIQPGQKGLEQLIASSAVKAVDRTIEQSLYGDKPSGPPLNAVLTQRAVAERSEAYKNHTEATYRWALGEVKNLLTAIAQSLHVEAAAVERIVGGFLDTFVTDRNILLNLSGVKSRERDYLFNHSLNVCLLSLNIAAAAGYNRTQTVEVGIGALLHDAGMLLVPSHIRFKQGRLTADELYEVQKHPIFGLHLIERIPRLPESASIVAYQQHERSNGTGYPRQRKGHLIHRYAKIVQCADIFEAVSSPRSYRESMAPYKGMEMLINLARQGFLDVVYVRAFLSYMSLFPVGSLVELNDGRIARVIEANSESFAKPIVSIVVEADGSTLPPEKIYQVDLARPTDQSLQIIRPHQFDIQGDLPIMHGF